MSSEDTNRYIEKLEEHISSTKKAVDYSLERFDILVISLSSGGLVLSIGFVKDIIKNYSEINLTLLKISWILFGVTLIANLFSQVTGYFTNNNEIKISKNLIRRKRNKEVKVNVVKLENWCYGLSIATNILNALCLISLISAITFLMIFININV